MHLLQLGDSIQNKIVLRDFKHEKTAKYHVIIDCSQSHARRRFAGVIVIVELFR